MKKLIGPLPPALPPPASPTRKRRHPNAVEANRPHQWTSGTARGQPDWLQAGDGGGRQCRVCGVTERSNLILADHAGFGDDGKQLGDAGNRVQTYIYEDAKGNTFASQRPLGCPVFILDHMGTTMENRGFIREHDDRLDVVDDHLDNHEDRLARLEAENLVLRAKLEERIDVTAMVDWLAEMVAQAAALKMQTVQVQVEGRPVAALPPPIANLIIDVGLAASAAAEMEPMPISQKRAQPDAVSRSRGQKG